MSFHSGTLILVHGTLGPITVQGIQQGNKTYWSNPSELQYDQWSAWIMQFSLKEIQQKISQNMTKWVGFLVGGAVVKLTLEALPKAELSKSALHTAAFSE